MKILFLHHNFPAQFGPIATLRASIGDDVIFITENNSGKKIKNVKSYVIAQKELQKNSSLNGQINCADRFYGAMLDLRNKGWNPDVIVSHSGWGCGLWSKLVFPKSKLISYLEWWFDFEFWRTNVLPADSFLGFDSNSDRKLYKRNLSIALELAEADTIVTPTIWQRDQLPSRFSSRALVIHEGVDTDFYRPNHNWRPKDKFRLTYASRGFEPIRGFHYFINALPQFLEQTHNTEVLIAGEDKICYGGHKPKNHPTWKAWASELLEPHISSGRVRFLGRLKNPYYARFLKSSHLHCYLTQPFIASWSLVEAMASGCNLLLADNAPIREVVDVAGTYSNPCDSHGFSSSLLSSYRSHLSETDSYGGLARRRAIDCYNRVSSLDQWSLVLES